MATALKLLAIALVVYWIWTKFSRRARIAPAPVRAAEPASAPVAVAPPTESPAAQSFAGRRLILVSAAGMVMSLFLDWVNFLRFSETGISLGLTALMLIWLYPVMAAQFSWRVHTQAARICAALAVLSGLAVLLKTINHHVLFFSVNVTGIGVVLYIVSSVLFLMGVFLYSNVRPLLRKPAMDTVKFVVPRDVKLAFDAAFAGQDQSLVVGDLMRDAAQCPQRYGQFNPRRANLPTTGATCVAGKDQSLP